MSGCSPAPPGEKPRSGSSPGKDGRRDAAIEGALVARALSELANRHAADHVAGRSASGKSACGASTETFVDALLDERSEHWRELAEAAFSRNGDPQIVAATLFRPASWIVGERWRTDETDFLKVTIAVTRMQRLFARMVREHPPAVEPSHARRVLLAPTPGDQHGFGLTVVEDAFRRAGWDVDCCACDEGADLVRLAGASEYGIIGLSVNVGRLLPDLAPLVAGLRARSANRSVVMMAGGSLFVDHPDWAIEAGFDLSAADAQSAVGLAEAAFASHALHGHWSMAAE